MSVTRRSIFAPAGAALVLAPIAQSTASADALEGSVADEAVAELIRRSAEANAALMRGDIDGYRALNPHTDDLHADVSIRWDTHARPRHYGRALGGDWAVLPERHI